MECKDGIQSAGKADDKSAREGAGNKRPSSSGQFPKGKSGNPRGRPPKRPPMITERRELSYFFQADMEMVEIVENGKRKKVPRIVAIYRVMTAKALQGDFRFTKMLIELRRQFVEQVVSQQAAYADHLLKGIEDIRENGLTDKKANLMNETLFRMKNPFDL